MRMTALEFRVLWRSLGDSELPMSLDLVDRTHLTYRSDISAIEREALQRVTDRVTSADVAAFLALAASDYRIDVTGRDAARPVTSDNGRVRIASAWAGGEHVYIAHQLPGISAGTDVVVDRIGFTSWTRSLVDRLPKVLAGTKISAVHQLYGGVVDFPDGDAVGSAVQSDMRARREFRRPPASTAGRVAVTVGGRDIDAPIVRRELWYLDRPGDGRYLIVHGYTDADVVPVDAKGFARYINGAVNAAQRERTEPTGAVRAR